jgi:hypothetical protein
MAKKNIKLCKELKKSVILNKKDSDDLAGTQEPIDKEGTSYDPFRHRVSKTQRYQNKMKRGVILQKGGITRGVRRRKL